MVVGSKRNKTKDLHAVQFNPPNKARGRVGAVGQIHLIYIVNQNVQDTNHIIYSNEVSCCNYNCEMKETMIFTNSYIWERQRFQELGPTVKQNEK